MQLPEFRLQVLKLENDLCVYIYIKYTGPKDISNRCSCSKSLVKSAVSAIKVEERDVCRLALPCRDYPVLGCWPGLHQPCGIRSKGESPAPSI